jgi:hypothetical protein
MTDPQPETRGEARPGARDGARDDVERDRVERRAEDLLPEEEAAGSDDPHAQARAILADSDERTDDPEGTGDAETPTQA